MEEARDWERVFIGHASIQQTQRYLNVTDEELRRGLSVCLPDCPEFVPAIAKSWLLSLDSNQEPSG